MSPLQLVQEFQIGGTSDKTGPNLVRIVIEVAAPGNARFRRTSVRMDARRELAPATKPLKPLINLIVIKQRLTYSEAMHCETCQQEAADDARFCINCGSMLAQICGMCGHRSRPDLTQCPACGAGFASETKVKRDPATPGFLATRAAREGERKHLTILIADVAGSTALVDHLNAEEAAERLGELTAAMREAVARFEGTVNKLQGDGIMALFGAPIPLEDHAVRACCAALAMIENVRKIDNAPAIRVGINTGEVVVRAVLTDVSAQYDAMGRTVHVASRLEHEAPDFGVVVSAATLRATAGAVETESMGERSLRGISEPVTIHVLKGIRPAIASQQFRGGQKLSPFVGRSHEFAALNRAMEEARAGHSPVLGVVGEAGSGKSRLVFQFLESCRAAGIPILEARATGYGRATPLRPVLDLIRTFFGIEMETSKEIAAGRVRAALQRHGLTPDLPLLLDFLGLPLAGGEALPSDLALRHLQFLDALRRLVRAVALAQSSILVVEDLHWLDQASEPFLEVLADTIAGTTSLMLVNFRKDYATGWMKRPYYRQTALQPLDADSIQAMLDHALGEDSSLAHLRHQIIARAGGNPFFAEELVRSSIEQEILTGTTGDFRATAAGRDASLPATIEAVLGSRIDRLPENDKLFLQAASVVGKEFPLSVGAQVAHITVEQARRSAQRLLGAEMLYERLDVQRDNFAFRHPLVQEAAYGSLLTEQRRQLHQGTAAALAVQFREQADEYSSLIGHHWEEGGKSLFAASSYLKFALWIGARDPRNTLDSWRSVRRLLQDQPSSVEIDYMLMMACGQIVNYAWWQGIDAAEIEPVFQQAIVLAHKLNDMRAAALITMAFGRILMITGSSDAYVEKVEEAQKLNQGTGNRSVEAFLRTVNSHALLTAGLLPRALEANTLALDSVHDIDKFDRQTLGFDPEPWLKVLRARILLYLDRFPEAAILVDGLLDGRQLETVHRVNAHGTRIEGYRKTQADLAVKEAERLRDILQKNATPYLRVIGNRYCALALLAGGSAQDAIDLLTETLGYARTQKAGLEVEPYLLTALAEAMIATGSPAARATALEALDLAQRRAMRSAEQEARALLASIDATE
jgi:class 3 adenylate cyclase